MKNRTRRAFDSIRADDALKEKTAAFLRAERVKREQHGKDNRSLRLVAAFAAVIALAIAGSGYHLHYAAASYVSIDVNPSVELTLNRLDRVIGVYAFNPEGETVLRETSLNGKRYDEAAFLVVAAMANNGYFGEAPLVSLTVQTANNSKEKTLCDALSQAVSGQVQALRAEARVEIFPVSAQLRQTAHACHMSPAKYSAIQELIAVDEDATLEAYSDASIHQIRRRIEECRGNHGSVMDDAAASDEARGRGHGHGHGQQNGQAHQ